ncbi:MAG: hypothetical protein JNM17_13115 [Archangium sp.]|nr:hypothetical protein [Archangium sp.]
MPEIPFEVFEPAMPEAMRALMTEARANRGPLVWLLHERTRASGGNCQAMLRGNPPLPTEIVGWAAGLSMFDANPRFTVDIIRSDTVRAPVPFVLEALGVGIGAGIEVSVNLWKCLEPLLRMSPQVPDALMRAMPVGLMSSSSITRAAALGVVRRDPKRATPIIESARLKKLTPTNAKRLDEALATLGPEKPTTAPENDPLLSKLLDAWAATFDPQLEAPINAAGAKEAAKRGPLKAPSKAELEQAWLALAAKKDPGDLDRLLGAPWPGAWKLALRRVEALGPFPPDPRFAQLTRHTARYTSWAGRAVGQAVSRVTTKHFQPKRGDAPPELLNESSSVTSHVADLDGLWKAFWEQPLDEGRRVVLADALQNASDPRGEFITLQMAIDEGRADAAAEKRANALLKSHIDSWAGSLPGAELASREFRRGFLSAITIRPDRDHLPKALERNEWRTVERLGINYLSIYAPTVGKLLERMPCIRVLTLNRDFMGSELEGLAPSGPFKTVKFIAAGNWIPLRRLEAFPSLEGVCAWAKDPRVALQAARRGGLNTLMLRSNKEVTEALQAWEKVSAVKELRLAPDMSSDTNPRGWLVRVTHDDEKSADLFLSGRSAGDFANFVKILAARDRTALRVHCPASLKPKLEKEAPDAELTFDHRPFDVFTL